MQDKHNIKIISIASKDLPKYRSPIFKQKTIKTIDGTDWTTFCKCLTIFHKI